MAVVLNLGQRSQQQSLLVLLLWPVVEELPVYRVASPGEDDEAGNKTGDEE